MVSVVELRNLVAFGVGNEGSMNYQFGGKGHINSCVCELIEDVFKPALEGILADGTFCGNKVEEFLPQKRLFVICGKQRAR